MTNQVESLTEDIELDGTPCVLDKVNKPVEIPEQRRRHLTHTSFGQIAMCRLIDCPYFYDVRTDEHYNSCLESVITVTEVEQ